MGHQSELRSGCFVIHQSDLELSERGSLRWAQVIGADDAANALSLFYLEISHGESPAMDTGESEAVLYLQQGQCEVAIEGRRFEASEGCGIHVRAGEWFSLRHQGQETVRCLVGICPRAESLGFDRTASGKGFDERFPDRCVSSTGRKLEATEDRFYKLLVGPAIGSESVTQFIGKIPPSRAPEHFHLYEEAICILSGHGRMWNGDVHAEVRPGSMIFLPRKQPHCLECLDEDGMELMGVFYPAGSPAINYKTST